MTKRTEDETRDWTMVHVTIITLLIWSVAGLFGAFLACAVVTQ